jgi:hypothetical protein
VNVPPVSNSVWSAVTSPVISAAGVLPVLVITEIFTADPT